MMKTQFLPTKAMCFSRAIYIFLSAFLAVLAWAEPMQIDNGRLRVVVEQTTGELTAFADVKSGQEFVGKSGGGLWELNFVANNLALVLKPANATSFKSEKIRSGQSKLAWSGFAVVKAPDLRVEVTVALDEAAAISRWKIAVKNLGALRLTNLHFPRLLNIPRQENEFLAVPNWMGQVTANPRELLTDKEGKSRRQEWEYPGHTSIQCLAFYQQNGPGLYLSCDDTNAFRKSFSFFGSTPGKANYEMVHLPENVSSHAANYELPYHAVIGTFQGDWLTAAEIYRGWATNQFWARESRLAKNMNASWPQKTALWVWNRGTSEKVLDPAIALQKKLGLPVSVFWHWWHGCAYDTGFPEYLPPRQGTESFQNALAAAHKKDVHALVYMNQRLWGMTTKSWTNENAETFAVKAADGKVRPEVYNTFTKQACASMCMDTSFWRNKYAGIAEEAFKSLKVDGIYMDQACSSLACYDPKHGHPIGGGTYWMNGFRQLSTDIRERTHFDTLSPRRRSGERAGERCHRENKTSSPRPLLHPMEEREKNDAVASIDTVRGERENIVLAGEGVGESWLPYLDLMLSLQVSKERYSAPDGWEPIPFFQAVYHPFVIQYGNYSSLTMPPYDELWPAEFAPKEPLKLLDRKFSRQFYLEQARAFVWGQQPTIANFMPSHLQERPEEIAYALQLAKIRHSTLHFLQSGTFLRAPELKVPEAMTDISRLSIYAGQQGGLTTFQKRLPLVIAGAWRATNGNIGIALASISDENISFDLPLESYGASERTKIYRFDEKGRKSLGNLKNMNRSLKVELAPREACLIELEGKRNQRW